MEGPKPQDQPAYSASVQVLLCVVVFSSVLLSLVPAGLLFFLPAPWSNHVFDLSSLEAAVAGSTQQQQGRESARGPYLLPGPAPPAPPPPPQSAGSNAHHSFLGVGPCGIVIAASPFFSLFVSFVVLSFLFFVSGSNRALWGLKPGACAVDRRERRSRREGFD